MKSNEKSFLSEHRATLALVVMESFAAVEAAMREADHALRHAAGSDPVAVADKLLAVAIANDAHTQALAHYRAAGRVFDLVEGILKSQRYDDGKLVSEEYVAPTAAEVVPFVAVED